MYELNIKRVQMIYVEQQQTFNKWQKRDQVETGLMCRHFIFLPIGQYLQVSVRIRDE